MWLWPHYRVVHLVLCCSIVNWWHYVLFTRLENVARLVHLHISSPKPNLYQTMFLLVSAMVQRKVRASVYFDCFFLFFMYIHWKSVDFKAVCLGDLLVSESFPLHACHEKLCSEYPVVLSENVKIDKFREMSGLVCFHHEIFTASGADILYAGGILFFSWIF